MPVAAGAVPAGHRHGGVCIIVDGGAYRESVDLTAEEFYVRMGETISHLEQLVERAARRRGSYHLEFVLESLRRLAHSGRMPAAMARLGDAVDLKPMLTLAPTGEVRPTGAVRGMERGVERVRRRVLQAFPPAVPGRVVVTHALLDVDARRLAEQLRVDRPGLDVDIAVFSPVMGASAGPIIGVAWEDPALMVEVRR